MSRRQHHSHHVQHPLTARVYAVLILCGLAAVLASGLWNANTIPPPPRRPRQPSDALLHARTIERLRGAISYYSVVGAELRRDGYPTRSVFNWRTPAHYELIAWVTVQGATTTLRLLAIAVVFGAMWAFARESPARCVAAGFLLFGGMLMPLIGHLVVFGEVCAGTLIGLSLALYARGRWFVLAAWLGIAAVFLREISVIYAVTCGVLAIIHRRRAESLTWIAGGLAYCAYYALHAMNVSQHIQPTDIAHGESWLQFQGLSFVLRTLHGGGLLMFMPVWITPVACVLALAAVYAPSIPPAVRWSLLLYCLFFSVAGQPFNFYWGWVSISIWCYALVYAGEGFQRLLDEAFVHGQSRTGGSNALRTSALGCAFHAHRALNNP